MRTATTLATLANLALLTTLSQAFLLPAPSSSPLQSSSHSRLSTTTSTSRRWSSPSPPSPEERDWKQALLEDDDLDIDAIIEANKETLPILPDIPTNYEPATGLTVEEAVKKPVGPAGDGVGPLRSKMKGLKGSNDADEENRKARQNKRLSEWLAENGVWMSDKSGWGVPPHPLVLSSKTIDEVELEDSGRGLICKNPINMGNALFQLPLAITIDKPKALEAFQGALPDDINEYFAIALMLIKQKSLGSKSFWSPYIDVLPTSEEVNPTLIWPEEDLALLETSPLVAATRSLKRKLQSEFEMLKEKYMDARPDLFPPEVFTFDEYLWAFINIFSRAIRVGLQAGEEIIMCPYADLINHNPFANTYIVAERPFKPFNPIRGDEVITIYADKDYRKMEQVYISYGPKSNADLLLLYGFCLDRNPFNSVEIKVSLLEQDPMYDEKRVFLAKAERRESEGFPLYGDRYPNELFEYLRLIYLTPEDMGGRSMSEIDYADPISLQNELAALASIESACADALESYSTKEEEDARLINDGSLFNMLPKTQRMAIKHRRSEKRLLKKTAAAVKQQMLNLKSGKRKLRPDEDD
jgi:histone-lysine N-methyltransferase SETD3